MIRLLPLLMLGALIAGFSTSSSVVAADKEKTDVVKLEGTICCGKCELKQSAACAVTIVVTKDGKKTTYWLDAETSKKYHDDICQEAKPGTVTGTVKKDGDKLILTAKELKFK